MSGWGPRSGQKADIYFEASIGHGLDPARTLRFGERFVVLDSLASSTAVKCKTSACSGTNPRYNGQEARLMNEVMAAFVGKSS
jgi:hypothetical protein